PARGERGRGVHHRALHLSSKLENSAQPQGQQGPADREGDCDPALSLSRRAAAGVARDAAAGGLGLQFRGHDAYARDPHLSIAPEGREGRRQPRHPGHRSRRLQAGALTWSEGPSMTIEDDIAFFERVPTLSILGRQALRILAIGAETRYIHGGEVL